MPAPVCAGPDCDRTHFNAIVTDQELSETYLPAFTRGCVQGGGTRSIMCSYVSNFRLCSAFAAHPCLPPRVLPSVLCPLCRLNLTLR